MYCKECGAEIEDGNFCKECGTKIEFKEMPHPEDSDLIHKITGTPIIRDSAKNVTHKKNVNDAWYLIGILLPVIGVLGGLIYSIKGYKNAPKVLIVSIIAWIVWAILLTR